MSLDIDNFSFEDSAKNRLAQTILCNVDMDTVLGGNSTNREFNIQVPEVSPITNQKKSGRCWLFAALNMFRPLVLKKYNLAKFEFSENYLFFYYKLEKANYFMSKIIATRNQPLDSRLVHHFLRAPISDGGKFHMAANLIAKYGVMPNELLPDTYSAAKTDKLNYILSEKLREYALQLREDPTFKPSFLKEIYVILCICLGTPMYRDKLFTWEYEDTKKTMHRLHITPCEFRDELGIRIDDHCSLYHDPRFPENVLYAKEWHTNMVGVQVNLNLNAKLQVLKQAAINSLKAGEPVWFACDVGKYSSRSSGILSMERNYSLAFGIDQEMSKKERILTLGSGTSHDMILVGVHVDANGVPVRWKVENSWGAKVGDKGYYFMSDEWFSEYVFQIIARPKYVDKESVDIWERGRRLGKYITLPFYDALIG